MHSVLAQLNKDHGNVARLLTAISDQTKKATQGHDLDWQILQKIFRYLTQYQDLFHHPKEDWVFGILIKREPSIGSDIAALESEHQQLYIWGAHLFAALSDPHGGGQEDILRRIGNYTELLDRHMRRESDYVFPLAEVILSPADWAQVESAVNSRQDPLFGQNVEAAYQGVLATVGKLIS